MSLAAEERGGKREEPGGDCEVGERRGGSTEEAAVELLELIVSGVKKGLVVGLVVEPKDLELPLFEVFAELL